MFIVFVVSLRIFVVFYVVVCMCAPLARKNALSDCLEVINHQSIEHCSNGPTFATYLSDSHS